ncbi:pre-mRNA-splicing factor 38a [Paraphaeosphaeria minitans]|uniref:Pre-mRNA-splicing factor 38 n=1 Tax=Paraphaeosphaeria minitans TaxID=565426 RepID=A0A9P6GLL9_9PLEO|nr:pre-mRNA-splicing factor 38a [Paraphaeosphaeria minitans]
MATIKADSGNVFDDRGYAGPTVRGGVNPVTLIEKAMRERIIESMYWKEQLFAVNEAMICDRVVALTHVGGSVNNRPTPFICILLKLLSLVPSEEIVLEMLNYEEEEDGEKEEEDEEKDDKEDEGREAQSADPDLEKEPKNGDIDDIEKEKAGKKGAFKYLRALAAFYVRLTMEPVQVYKTLEPLLLDRRKLKYRKQAGFTLTHIDEFVDNLLTQPRLCGTSLPALPPRSVLEDLDLLDPRESPLADEVEDMDLDGRSRSRSRSRSRGSSWSQNSDSRSRSRSRARSYTRSRSRSRSPRRDRDRDSRSRSRSRSRSQDYRRRSRSVDNRKG